MDDKNQLIKEINQLKKEKNAVILAHNYELGEIQDIADFCGDSLELSIKAANTQADVIVFCGVRFMAETAKLLSPDKKVLLPVPEATCDMAEMINRKKLQELKKEKPNAVVIAYVNTTAETKAECDICVTSSNALDIVASYPKEQEIIFVPDANLGGFCAQQTNKDVDLYAGCCPVHDRLTVEMVERKRREYPNAELLIHPEAKVEITNLADYALSTGKMLTHVKNSSKKEFIIATEIGIIHRLEKENPDKKFILLSPETVCPHMKLIQLKDVFYALKNNQFEIKIDKEIQELALKPIQAMLNFSK